MDLVPWGSLFFLLVIFRLSFDNLQFLIPSLIGLRCLWWRQMSLLGLIFVVYRIVVFLNAISFRFLVVIQTVLCHAPLVLS